MIEIIEKHWPMSVGDGKATRKKKPRLLAITTDCCTGCAGPPAGSETAPTGAGGAGGAGPRRAQGPGEEAAAPAGHPPRLLHGLRRLARLHRVLPHRGLHVLGA